MHVGQSINQCSIDLQEKSRKLPKLVHFSNTVNYEIFVLKIFREINFHVD